MPIPPVPPNDDQNPDDGFDLSSLEAKLNPPEEQIQTDPSDVITDKDKPVYSSKKKTAFNKLADTKITSEQISAEIKKAFRKKPQNSEPDNVLSTVDKKTIALSNVSSDIAQDKNTLKTWLPKVTSILPAKVYRPKLSIIGGNATARPIMETINAQTHLLADQFIRNKASDMIRDKIWGANHTEHITILSRIQHITQRNNDFFENTFRKYMMTSLELKFKHIFVSQDILKQTKLLIETIAAKLDSVKHNTALSEVSKISAFGELKRQMRLKANAAIADAALDPFKKPLKELVGKISEGIKDKVADKYARLTDDSPIQFDTGNDTIQDKAKGIIRKVKGDLSTTNNTYTTPDMIKVTDTDNQSDLQKLIQGFGSDKQSVIKTLSKKATDKADFDVITRRSIVDIIPSLLAKINQQSTIIAKSIGFLVKSQIPKGRHDAFDKDVSTEELRFDRESEDFTSMTDFKQKSFNKLFGNLKERTSLLQPTINKLHAGFTKHGGSGDEFKDALPDIVKFVTNISKHAKVVKLSHIKKYLEGGSLSAFEQGYLDSILVDIPEDSKHRLVKILGTAFFKDDKLDEVDTDVSYDIGSEFRKLIKEKEKETEKIAEAASYGDLRGLDVISDKKGVLNQPFMRRLQANVDTDDLSQGIDNQEAIAPKPDIVSNIRNAINEQLKPVAEKLSSILPSRENIKDFKLKPFRNPFKRDDIDDLSSDTGVPNRDDIQISGPGVYYQGAKEELHIPLDDLKSKIRNAFDKVIGKGNKLKDEIKTNIPSSEELKEKVDTTKSTIAEHTDALKLILKDRLSQFSTKKTVDVKDESKDSSMLDVVTNIRDTMIQQFKTLSEYHDTQIDISNQMLIMLSQQASGKSGEDPKKTSLLSKALMVPLKLGKKGAGLYYKGMKSFYGNLFGLSKKALTGSTKILPSVAGGAFNLGKKGLGLAGDVLSNMLGLYTKPASMLIKGGVGLAKGAVGLGKKLFSKEKKFVDVYRKDEVDRSNPLLKGILIKSGHYVYEDGTPVDDSSSIRGPVYDSQTNQLIISADDIKHGLVDFQNKPIVGKSILSLGGSLIKKGVGAYISLAKGSLKLTKGMLGATSDVLGGLLSLIPGVGGSLKRKKKGKGGTVLDVENLNEMVTKHLIKIENLISPISKHYASSIREGSYTDYLRDRDTDKGKSKPLRARDLRKAKESATATGKGNLGTKAIAGAGIMGGLAKMFGVGGDSPEGEGGGDGIVGTTAKSLAGGYVLNKARGLFAKKAVETVVDQGAKQAVKQGMLRTAMSGLARFGIGQGLRSLAVTGATAIAGTLSAPVVLGGLAIAGLTAGGVALYSWNTGKKRRESITAIRNAVYHVPEDKLKVIIDLENDLAETLSDNKKSELVNSRMRDYIKDVGLDPDDQRQFTFFKHWYVSLFFPIFKASYDIITNSFKIKFKDQDSLTDDQLSAYKQTIEESKDYQELKAAKLELSPKGFKDWEKESYFGDDEYTDTNTTQKNIDKRLDEAAKLIATKSGSKSVAGLKFDEMQEKAAEREDDMFSGVGEPSFWREDNIPKTREELAKTHLNLPAPSTPEKSLEEYQKTFGRDIPKDDKSRKSKSVIWDSVEKPMVEQLIRLGWTKEQAIGIAANVKYESGGDHTAEGDKSKKTGEMLAYGLAQWHPPRQALFKKKFGKDIRQASFAEQVAFIDYELNNGDSLERKAGRLIKQAPTAEEAAGLFTRWFERPADIPGETSKRSAFAAKMKRNYSSLDEKKVRETEDTEPADPSSIKTPKDEATEKALNPESDKEKAINKAGFKSATPAPVDDVDGLDGIGMPSVWRDDNIATSQKNPATQSAQKTITKAEGSGGGWFSSVKKSLGFGDSPKESGGGDLPTESDGSVIATDGALGDSVAKYESGSKGVASVSSGKGDPGGASYGKYQLASKTGTLQRYLKQSGYAESFSGMNPGQPDFNAKWVELAKSDPNFGNSQHDFIKKTHFDPAIKKAAELGFASDNRGVQEAIWSGSIQHGGIKRILAKTAEIPGFKEMSPGEQIAAFYKTRGDYAASAMRANGASESTIQNASYGRYSREIKDALALAGSNVAQENVSATTPQPGPLKEQGPVSENKVVEDIQEKNIKAGLPVTDKVSQSSAAPSLPSAGIVPTPVTKPPEVAKVDAMLKNNTQAPAAEAVVNTAAPSVPNVPSNIAPTSDTYVDQFVANNKPSAPKAISPIDHITRINDNAAAASVASAVTPEITVNDPESKTQTGLLTEQNQLLSKLVNLMSGQTSAKPEVGGTTNDPKNDEVVNKLDEIVKALNSNNQQLVGAMNKPAAEPPSTQNTRTINPTKNTGIDVARATIPAN